MKIAFLFKHPKTDDPAALHEGLGITAMHHFMSMRDAGFDSFAAPIPNGEYLWAQLSSEWSGLTHVVLEAPFIDAAFLKRLFAAFPAVRFCVLYHSNVAFLSSDVFAGSSLPLFLRLQAEFPNFWLGANCRELSEALHRSAGVRVEYLPNMYHLPSKPRPRAPHGHRLNVGLFGAARQLKNWLTGAVAAMILSRDLDAEISLHVSVGREEAAAGTRANIDALLGLNPMVALVKVPWLAHDDFLRYLRGMDLLLQPSFTESFNNVTADGISVGVPSVVSDAIPWVPPTWIAKADSAVSIAAAARRLLADPQAPAQGWHALNNFRTCAVEAWRSWIVRPA